MEHQREEDYKALATADAAAGPAFAEPYGLSEIGPPLRRVLLEIEVSALHPMSCVRPLQFGAGCSLHARQDTSS